MYTSETSFTSYIKIALSLLHTLWYVPFHCNDSCVSQVRSCNHLSVISQTQLCLNSIQFNTGVDCELLVKRVSASLTTIFFASKILPSPRSHSNAIDLVQVYFQCNQSFHKSEVIKIETSNTNNRLGMALFESLIRTRRLLWRFCCTWCTVRFWSTTFQSHFSFTFHSLHFCSHSILFHFTSWLRFTTH